MTIRRLLIHLLLFLGALATLQVSTTRSFGQEAAEQPPAAVEKPVAAEAKPVPDAAAEAVKTEDSKAAEEAKKPLEGDVAKEAEEVAPQAISSMSDETGGGSTDARYRRP